MADYISKIKELELLFSDNGYDGSGDTAFVIEEGSIPIIVSAPHAINHFRDGKVKWADMYTGGIARYLHEVTGCHLIYSCKFSESDPNYDAPGTNKYQDAILEYLTHHKVVVLLDLHGAAKKREYAVEMGTAPVQHPLKGVEYENDPSLHEFKFISGLIKNILENRFANLSTEKKKVWKNQIFDAGDQNTVTKFISENTETACIQLEINGCYRDPENEKEFICLIDGLIEIINILSNIDWENKPFYPLKR